MNFLHLALSEISGFFEAPPAYYKYLQGLNIIGYGARACLRYFATISNYPITACLRPYNYTSLAVSFISASLEVSFSCKKLLCFSYYSWWHWYSLKTALAAAVALFGLGLSRAYNHFSAKSVPSRHYLAVYYDASATPVPSVTITLDMSTIAHPCFTECRHICVIAELQGIPSASESILAGIFPAYIYNHFYVLGITGLELPFYSYVCKWKSASGFLLSTCLSFQ